MISAAILTALLPAAGDLVKGLIGKLLGGKGAVPINIDEVIKLKEAENKDKDADVRRLEALAKIDHTESVPSWVNAVRAMQRPTVVGVVLLAWGYGIAAEIAPETMIVVADLASAVIFYLFGERVYMRIKK